MNIRMIQTADRQRCGVEVIDDDHSFVVLFRDDSQQQLPLHYDDVMASHLPGISFVEPGFEKVQYWTIKRAWRKQVPPGDVTNYSAVSKWLRSAAGRDFISRVRQATQNGFLILEYLVSEESVTT